MVSIDLSTNGKWNQTKQSICDIGTKSVYNFLNVTCELFFIIFISLHIFDTLFSPFFHNDTEVWWFHPANAINCLHLKYCTKYSDNRVYDTLGRFPLSFVRKLKIIKYWLKFLKGDYNILYKDHNILQVSADNNCNYNVRNWHHGLGIY